VPHVLLLTGTCGSGKTTIASLLGTFPGWTHVSEDPIWGYLYGRQRGAFGSAEHRRKRGEIHKIVYEEIVVARAKGLHVALDATVHQSPPEAYSEYRRLFLGGAVTWGLRVLHPRLEVAIARDAQRQGWQAGADRVTSLYGKFTGATFAPAWFLDTSEDTPADTVRRLLASSVV
jgi:predicted kinase